MDGLVVPEKKDFYVPLATKDKLMAIAKMSRQKPQNVLVKGMQGCGKSELAEQFAAILNRPFACFQIGLLAETGQLFGQQTLKDNNVMYQQFLFTDVIKVKDCVILMDEINREQNPKALNDLFSVLDERRFIWIDELQKRVDVAEGVVFFATINEGPEFVGTELLDAAISDRFFVVEVGPLPADEEIDLLCSRTGIENKGAVELENILRAARSDEIQISTRKAIAIAELVTSGLSIRESFEFALGLDRDKLERILLNIHLDREDELDAENEEWTTL